ncbi:oligosaccharide flippase family protein [Sphingomonas sp. TREG-RG-20F-R18-01]|uniref:oligosaccharide flippase family protein n=1 Tax=Sphingomonas sp. TREG-RG-20F-R18-01 TaxID=2914982 RepID=UPI001F582C0E|nr:oligosaccharide flippase family protein [Sphingomonas sp. TREG-RG-20F-R18-01]
MSDAKASYRQILKSTSIVGGATVGSLVFGLARSKAIALLAGPAGIGLFGVLNTLFMTGTAIAGLNLWASGVRQVGSTPPDSVERARAVTALWIFAWLATIVGGSVFWAFERFYYVPATPALKNELDFPWIALAVALNTLNSVQLILLQVSGRIGAIAYIRLLGAMLSAIVAILAVYMLGVLGLYVAILAVPVSGIALTLLFSRSLERSPWQGFGGWILTEWRGLVVMGLGLAIANFITSISQLTLRSVITAQDGLGAAGLFQASWTLSNVNLTIVLSAMVVDYYPRLTAVIRSPQAIAEIMNQQIRIGLLFLGPVLTLAVGFAPLIVLVLYSSSFSGAASILQWQIVGDVFKLHAWAIGFVLLAINTTSGYVLAGLAFDLSIVGLVWALYPLLGLESAGIGYVIAQLLAVTVSATLVGRHGIRIDRDILVWAIVLAAGLAALVVVSHWSMAAGMLASLAACGVTLAIAWREVHRMELPLPSWLDRRLRPGAVR